MSDGMRQQLRTRCELNKEPKLKDGDGNAVEELRMTLTNFV